MLWHDLHDLMMQSEPPGLSRRFVPQSDSTVAEKARF
jgi:hypothetical protein